MNDASLSYIICSHIDIVVVAQLATGCFLSTAGRVGSHHSVKITIKQRAHKSDSTIQCLQASGAGSVAHANADVSSSPPPPRVACCAISMSRTTIGVISAQLNIPTLCGVLPGPGRS